MSLLLQYDLKGLEEAAFLVGVDEVGRGALAGPVVACAVKMGLNFYQKFEEDACVAIVKDSKLVVPHDRQKIADRALEWAKEGAIGIAIAKSSVAEIEIHNILGATKLAMERAIQKLGIDPDIGESLPLFRDPTKGKIWIDGLPLKKFPYPHEALVKGDQKSFAIALASILAKNHRDMLMGDLDPLDLYGFAKHKGYGTAFHSQQLQAHGLSCHHRKQFVESLLKKFQVEKNEALPTTNPC